MRVYQFTCCFGGGYVGCTMRGLSTCISEHNPVRLSREERKPSNSSILDHLTDYGHVACPQSYFSILDKVKSNGLKGVRIRHLFITEALAIKQLEPGLCVHQMHVHSPILPWS
ncbi:unnamed protein product [Heterobilharzia americana]|nr:unnamed protein product [Heterobilharzia americana]